MRQTSTIVCDEATATTLTPDVGDVVGGKYRLLRLLGEGGMGVVFEAEHLRLKQNVAIKYLRPDVLAMPDAVQRFDREARAICRMRGPHVAHVLDVDADALGRPYMVMELLRGRDLEAELQDRGALPIAEAVDWVLQACAAVAEAHAAGIVHRDLKPSNLFLAEEAGVRVLKVLDFGISKLARDEPAVTSTAITLGTPLYMSPEQVRSSRDVDGRADIWSLGVILYELVAGEPPFLGTTTAAIAAIVADATPRPRSVRPDVPEGLERAIVTALAKRPDDRFPNAEALAAAIVPFASAEGAAGPFSLRPSQQAFEVATTTMARVPSGPHASDASDLLRLPTSRTTRRAPKERSLADAFRTFAGTLAIGFGLAAGASLGAHRDPQPDPRPLPRVASQGTVSLDSTNAGPPRAPHAIGDAVDTATAPGDVAPAPQEESRAPAPPVRIPGLTIAARPHTVAPPGPPPSAPSATPAGTASPHDSGRVVPRHAPSDRPLYL
jgi:serine/threonine-protein kinase